MYQSSQRKGEKLELKDVNEHDSTLVQSNELALKQGEKFADSFNVKRIRWIEAKLTKVTQDVEALENNKKSYDSIFKAYTNSTSKKKTAGGQMKERS